MVHKAIAQTMITSMQNLSLTELTINFSNTMGMSIAPRLRQYGPFDSDQTAGQKLAHRLVSRSFLNSRSATPARQLGTLTLLHLQELDPVIRPKQNTRRATSPAGRNTRSSVGQGLNLQNFQDPIPNRSIMQFHKSHKLFAFCKIATLSQLPIVLNLHRNSFPIRKLDLIWNKSEIVL